MSESIPERDRLLSKLKELDDITQEEEAKYVWGVSGRVGHRSLAPRLHISSGIIFICYVAFNIIAFVVGIIMIVNNGVLRELGIAIVVGSLFAFGSFIAQWWTVRVQSEIDFVDRVYGSIDRQQQLGEMRTAIIKRLDELSGPDESGEQGAS